jgi:aminoglycoside 3-N-acetyltransferase
VEEKNKKYNKENFKHENMKIVKREEIIEALKKVGIKKGDIILVHSALSKIGRIDGEKEGNEYLNILLKAFFSIIGKRGTLVVPAFFYEYGRYGTAYDMRRSPVSSELGVFARYIAGLPEAVRSTNPITALAAIGAQAEYICGGGTGSSFGVDSPWDRLYKSNDKMVFLGIYLRAMTFIHYVEHMVGVPHLYNKYSTVPILKNGRAVKLSVCSQVRYLDFGIEYDALKNTFRFEKAGLVNKAKIGSGIVRCLSCKEFFEFAKEKVKKDNFYFLKQPPKFVVGKIPMDGSSGPARP